MPLRLALLLLFLTAPTLRAQTTWVGNTSTSWEDNNNWSPATFPNHARTVVNFGASANTALAINSKLKVDGVRFNADASAYTITIKGGDNHRLTLSGSGVVNLSSVPQTFVIEGSSVEHAELSFTNDATAANVVITAEGYFGSEITWLGKLEFHHRASAGSASVSVGDAAYVLFNETSTAGQATFTTTGKGEIDFRSDSTAAGATFHLNAPDSRLWFSNLTDAGQATINVDAGAHLIFRDSSSASLALITGQDPEARVSFTEDSTGGSAFIDTHSLLFCDRATAGGATFTLRGTGVFSDVSTGGSAALTVTTGQQLEFKEESSLGAAIVTLEDGAVVAFSDTATGGTGGITTASDASGTLDLSESDAADFYLGSIDGEIALLLGAGRLNVGDAADMEISGAISGDGGLVKTGSGTLVLSGENSYTGATTVSAGTLTVDGSLAPDTTVTVANGATLDGIGTINGEVVLQDGAMLAGTIAFGSTATLSVGSESALNAAITAATAGSTIKLTANIALTGALAALTKNLTLQGNGFALTGATGANAFTVTSGEVTLDDLPISDDYVIQDTARVTQAESLTLGVNAAGSLTISGGGRLTTGGGEIASAFDSTATVTGAGSTWENDSGVIVGGGASGTLTVAGGGLVKGAQFELGNDGGTSVLQVDGSAASGRGAVETGAIIKAADAVSVSIAIDGGVLRANAASGDFIAGFLAGEVTLESEGAFVDTNGFDVTIGLALEGEGGLTKQGAGTLTLTASQAYAGPTTVAAGTLTVNGSLDVGSSVDVAEGATLDGTGTIKGGVILHDGATLGSGLTVLGAVTHSAAPLLFVPNANDNSVSVYRINPDGALALVKTIAGVGTGTVNYPRAVVVRPDQAFAYVTIAGAGNDVVKVIDTRTLAVDESLTVATGIDPLGAAISPDGSRLYVGHETAHSLSVFSIDAITGALASVATIATPGMAPSRVAVSPDGTRAYATVAGSDSVYVVDTAALALDGAHPSVAVGASPAGLVVDPSGAHVYVGSLGSNNVSVIDTTTFAVTSLDIGARSAGIAISPDGDHYYAVTYDDDSVIRFDPTGGMPAVLQTMAAGSRAIGVAMNADGTALYVTNVESDDVSIFAVSPGTGELTAGAPASIAAGAGPFLPGVAVNGNSLLASGQIFVANRGGSLAAAGSDGAVFDGGTVLINGSDLVFRTPISLGSGGGTLDTNGNDAEVQSSIGGRGALTKTGAGTLTLSGANGFTGGTIVSEGTLTLGHAGGLGTGDVTVEAGATLDVGGFDPTFTSGTVRVNGTVTGDGLEIDGAMLAGNGTIEGDVMLSSGTVAPGNSIGALAIEGDFTWTAGSVLTFELGVSGVCDQLTIARVLTKSGVGSFTFNFGGTGVAGTYTLMEFASQTGFAAANFNATNLGGNLEGSFVLNGTQLQFVASEPPPDVEATLTLSDLAHTYDGVAKQVKVTTDPAALDVLVTYNRSTTRPIAAGRYTVHARVIAAGYSGEAEGTLVLSPAIVTAPSKQTVAAGGAAAFTVAANGGSTALTYQWRRNGVDLPGAVASTLNLSNVQPGDAGIYTVAIAGGGATAESVGAPLELAFDGRLAGSGREIGSDIVHPNGRIYDQVLLTGTAVSVKADPAQVVRVSYVDLSDDIVQVEFAGAGVLTLSLTGASGPAIATNYDQPDVSYMKGHATVTITGADATSNLTVFSVGRITAVNPLLFRNEIDYDGMADVASVVIAAADGKFGGLRLGNVSFVDTAGWTGVYAPNAMLEGPLYIGDIHAADDARGRLVVGAVDDARITGGDLWQANDAPVEVNGLSELRLTAGENSHGESVPAQRNRGTLVRDGVDVTRDLVRQD